MNKAFKPFFKTNSRYIFLFIGLGLLNLLLLFIHYRSFNTAFFAIILISIILEIFLSFIILRAKKNLWPIEKVFLVLGLVTGITYVFTLPIGRAPDEASHFNRIYEITSGHLISETAENGSIGSNEPENLALITHYSNDNVTYEEIATDLFTMPSDESSFIHTSAYTYNILSYLPQIIAMFLGRLFGFSILVCAYLAKLFNFITCFTILYFCIKYIPFLKKSLFFLAFLPITMQAMASLSPDGLAIASCVALFTFVLYTTYQQKTLLTKQQLTLICIICIFIVLSKIVYAPLCLALFIIPKKRFGSMKQKIIWALIIGGISAIVLITWQLLMPPVQSVSDSNAQITSIFQNPLKFLASVFGTIIYHFSLYLNGLLGGHLEWFSVNLSTIYITASTIVLAFICYFESKTAYIKLSHKIIFGTISASIVFLIFTVMFIQWTKTGEIIIDGVQGRYFLPIFLTIPILCLPTKTTKTTLPSLKTKFCQNYYLYAFFIFESVYALTAIACAHI